MNARTMIFAYLLLPVLAMPACAEKSDGAEPEPQSSTEIAAYVADIAIPAAELDTALAGQLAKLRQQEYEMRRAQLDQKIAQVLVDREAEARGITADELLESEVLQKVAPPTEDQVKQFYEANKNAQQLQGKSYEEVKPMMAQSLLRQLQFSRRNAYLSELRSQVDVRILLDAPRVAVNTPPGEPTKGPEDAPVTIVEFSDFQCSYCKRAEPAVERLLAEYGDKVRLVYRDYPLNFHPRAAPAAIAARCAGDQDKYWEYHSNLFRIAGDLEDADLRKRAADVGLDVTAFNACYDEKRHSQAVQAAFEEGARLGVTGTPTFFINGRMMVGAQPYEALKAVVDEELERAAAEETTAS